MREIAQLIRQKAKESDAPEVKKKRTLKLDPGEMARAAFERHRVGNKSGDDFLSEDGPGYDADEYINTTGLDDGMDLGEVEGDGDKRKAMLMKAMRNTRGR